MRLPVSHALIRHTLPFAALALLSACGSGTSRVEPLPSGPVTGPAADYPVIIGAPFTIDGTTYTPEDRLNYDAVGYAAIGSDGGTGVSLAHKTLPLPSYVEVTSLVSGKTILVRAERRGPQVNDRLVELSPAAAEQLGVTGVDKPPVRIRRVNPPEQERALLRTGQRVPARMETPKGLLTALLRKLDPALIAPPAPAPEPSAAPTTAPTPAAPVKPVKKPQPVPAPQPSVTPDPAPKPALPAAPAPTAAPTPTPAPAPAPTPTPAPVAKPKPKPAPVAQVPAPAPAPGASATGRFTVQIATFSSKDRADAAAGKLGAHVGQAGRLYPIRLGPFSTRAEADAALARARAGGYRDARIQRAD